MTAENEHTPPSARDEGGPAFPCFEIGTQLLDDRKGGNYPNVTSRYNERGMSLRDWFAGQALIGYFACGGMDASDGTHDESRARRCYELADAMLAARTSARKGENE